MLPWQQTLWQNLTSSKEKQRLAHGLLFHGAAGLGKSILATQFAHWLLCQQPLADKACGSCKSCLLIKADSHPDLINIEPEEPGKAIKVDQIRDLISKMALTSHKQGYRVIIISPADALNINASNSLLKTLEEPPENTLLILITDKLSKLMPTIRSRTQLVRFNTPTTEESLDWLKAKNVNEAEALLKLSAGAPLAAFEMANDDGLAIRSTLFNNWQALSSGKSEALESAALWLKDGFKIKGNMPLFWMESWIADLIRSLHGSNIDDLVNKDFAQSLQKMAGQVDLKSVYGLLDRLNDTLRVTDTSANQLMLIEGLLLHWAGLKRH